MSYLADFRARSTFATEVDRPPKPTPPKIAAKGAPRRARGSF